MGLVKNNTGLEEIKESVANVENISTEIKANVNEVKTDTEGIVLSNESIKAIVDEIQNRIGLTGDTGGSASAGSVMSKLNQIIGSAGSGGGITGFKYIDKTTTSRNGTTYTTKASGILLVDYAGGVYIQSGGYKISMYVREDITGDSLYSYIGFFQKGAKIEIERNSHAHIFEFI